MCSSPLSSMRFVVISGSHRNGSESKKVGHYVSEEIKNRFGVATHISLEDLALPLWSGETPPVWLGTSSTLQSADALVFVVPEWNGMVPPGVKNFLTYAGPQECAHKPALIIAISSGMGGSYCVSELRSSGYKNNRLCFIPEHVVVRFCQELTDTDSKDQEASSTKRNIQMRITYALSILNSYALALRSVRESGVINHKDFPYGM
jgi:multimeric flavodoxin WrbA